MQIGKKMAAQNKTRRGEVSTRRNNEGYIAFMVVRRKILATWLQSRFEDYGYQKTSRRGGLRLSSNDFPVVKLRKKTNGIIVIEGNEMKENA